MAALDPLFIGKCCMRYGQATDVLPHRIWVTLTRRFGVPISFQVILPIE